MYKITATHSVKKLLLPSEACYKETFFPLVLYYISEDGVSQVLCISACRQSPDLPL